MLREAATGAGHRRHARATPATTARPIEAWLDTPGGIAVAPNGDVYFADSNNDVIRRDRRAQRQHRAGRRQPRARHRLLRRQRPGDRGAARHAGRRRDRARRRPDRRRLAQRSHPPRRPADAASSRRSPARARTATTATTSRRSRRRSTRRAPSRAAPNGDIYIADTLNYRIRMIDAQDRPHPHRGRRRHAGRRRTDRRRRPGDERAPQHAERRRDRAATATSTSPTCTTTASGKVDAQTHIITTVAGNGAFGATPATMVRRRQATPGRARRASRVVAGRRRHGDDLHRRLLQRHGARRRPRRHHPRRQRRRARGVRRADARRVRAAARGWLYVADSSKDQVVAAEHPEDRAEPACRRGRVAPPRKVRRMTSRRTGRRERDRRPAPAAGRCRSCGRTAARVALLAVLLLLGDRARRAAAVAAHDRHRLRARRHGRFPSRSQPLDRRRSRGGNRFVLLVVVVIAGVVLQVVNQFVSAYGTQVQVDTGQRMVYDLRVPAVRAPAGARPAPSHHDEHGRRGLPRRRRRLRDREPGDERRLPARHVGHRR